MAQDKDEEEERRSGAVLPWWRAASGGEGGFGPMGLLRSLGRAFLVAPEATFLRVLAGGLVALGGTWGIAAFAGRSAAADGSSILSPFLPTPAGLSTEGALAGRSDLATLVRGMEGLWGTPPDSVADAAGSTAGADAAPELPMEGDGAAGKEEKGSDGAKSAEGGAGGAGTQDAQGEVAVGGAGAPLGAGLGAGALASAASVGAGKPGTGGPSAGAAEAGVSAALRQMRAGTLRSARLKGGNAGKGALSQLKFADRSSQLGASAASAERSYQAAQSAFEGGSAGVGSPIGGAGAGDGGAGVSASPRGTIAGPTDRTGPRLSCPSGYTLDGGDCRALQGENKTPYQGLADTAKTLLILGAVLAAVGLLLVTRPLPWMQIVGGMMLGAAAALILIALAIGADIKNRYGQGAQKDSIDSAGSRAGQGKSP
ncbi:MAG: hypothetical protein HY928_04070 [Elusimicrobia bacterium]|nr:hypothetical protein [Elusimicrobiota bacterium]